jgi:choice-of-anchor C domain-containing protein
LKINSKYLLAGILSLVLIGGFGNAFAATNIVNNGSFENTGCGPLFDTVFTPDSTTITGWTVGLDSIDWICGYWTAQDGSNSIDMSGNAAGSISQDLTTIAGAVYDVKFYMSGNTDSGNIIKQLTATAAASSGPFTYDTTGNPSGTDWELKTFPFTATGATTTLTFTSDEPNAYGAALDNVSVVLSRCPAGFDLTDDTCIPSNQNPVAGELVPLNTTALFISSLSSSAIWMVPAILGIAGVGIYFIQTRTHNKDN